MAKGERSLWETKVTSVVIFLLTVLAWSTFGRPRALDTVDVDVVQAALSHLESSTNNFFARKVFTVKEAEVESGSGDVYTFTLGLKSTKCPKRNDDPDFDATDCEDNNELEPEECRVRVFLSPSSQKENKPRVEVISCHNVVENKKAKASEAL